MKHSLAVEPWDPAKHRPHLDAWHLGHGLPVLTDGWYPATGYVGLCDGQPTCVLFMWVDPTSRRAFIDDMVGDPKAGKQKLMGAAGTCLRAAMAEASSIGIKWMTTTTYKEAIASFLKRKAKAHVPEERAILACIQLGKETSR
jgi:hypothetical protein